MEQLTKILTSNFTSNALITAFVVVGIVCWVAAWISTHVFRGKIHSSAIAIAAGLLLAWLGGELTGGKKGLSDITLFSGIALMGGGMFRDFAIIATAFGVKLDELKKAGLAGALALVVSTVLSFTWGASCRLGLRLYRCGQHGDYRRRRGDLYRRPGYRCGAWRKFRCYRAQYRCRGD